MAVTIAYLGDEQGGGPAGVRVVEPTSASNQAQRGNLYAVVDLQGPHPGAPDTPGEHAALTERVLSALQRTYFTAKGTQSQVMEQTLQAAQQLVRNENAQRQAEWRAGVLCIGLLHDRLAIAAMGDAFAFVTTDGGDVNVYPPERLKPGFDSGGGFALWPLHRQKIELGGAILAGSGRWLAAVDPRMLAGATAFVAAETCRDAAEGLREQAGDTTIPGILLVFADDAALPPLPGPSSGSGPGSGRGPSPPSSQGSGSQGGQPAKPPPSQGSPAGKGPAAYAVAGAAVASAAGTGMSQHGHRTPTGLPTAVNATPPIADAPPAQAWAAAAPTAPAGPPSAAAAAGAAAAGKVVPAPAPAAPYAPAYTVDDWTPDSLPPEDAAPAFAGQGYASEGYAGQGYAGQGDAGEGDAALGAGATGYVPAAAATAGPAGPTAAERMAASAAVAYGVTRAGLTKARGMVASMLPDRSAGTTPNVMAGNRDLYTAAALPATGLPPGSAGRTDTFTPPPAAAGSRARLFLAIAAIVLLLIPALVAGLYWQRGATNRAEAESLLDLADARVRSAQDALDQEDKTTARAMLTEANEYVLQSQDILGSTARSGQLLDDIRTEQQQVMQITPLYGLTQPLATFPSEASPQRVMVNDQDVYVLDSGRGEVIRYRLDVSGETLAEEGQVVLREGDVVNGVTIGPMVDIAWQSPIPLFEDKASLLLLDANNRVFRYNQVDAATLVSFGDPVPWQQATQLEVFSDRVYVADAGANQIYRYAPGTYQDPPTAWFQPTTQVRLQGVKALRIDGDLWLLFDDGKVVRYHAGEQVPYGLDDSVGLATDPVDLYVSQSAADKTLYLADAAEERVLFFDKDSGKFLGQFQAAEGRPLRGLRSIFIDEARGTIFLLTRDGLYVQRLPR